MSSSEGSAEQWDAETILTTYTNTDNHPGLIKYVPKIKPSQRMKIELDKRERQMILDHLANSPIPWCHANEKREVERLRQKLQNHT